MRSGLGSGLAAGDPLVDQGVHRGQVRAVHGQFFHLVQRVQRHAQAPQHQPGGFVKGIGRALPK